MLTSLPSNNQPTVSNADLIAGIRRNDPAILEAFYLQFESGLRYIIKKTGALAQDVEDIAHETILITIRQIQQGTQILNADALPSYLLIVAKRHTWHKIFELKRFVSADPIDIFDVAPELEHQNSLHHAIPSPEDQVLRKERSDVMLLGLKRLKPAEVEILTRFYLREQSHEQIELEMGLTDTQFRLNKCRAKGKLEKACREILARKKPRLVPQPLVPKPALAVS